MLTLFMFAVGIAILAKILSYNPAKTAQRRGQEMRGREIRTRMTGPDGVTHRAYCPNCGRDS